MPRPKFINEEDLLRWSKEIDSNPFTAKFANSALLREVCYAGCYLSEQLHNLNCPKVLITRICFSAGKESFGKDVWDIHLQFLEDYKNDSLDFEIEQNNLN